MPEKINFRLAFPLQGVPKVAMYTLATMAAQGLSFPVWAASGVDSTHQPQVVGLEGAENGLAISEKSGVSQNHGLVNGMEKEVTPKVTPLGIASPYERSAIAIGSTIEAIASPEFSLRPEFTRNSSSRLMAQLPHSETGNLVVPAVENPQPSPNLNYPETDLTIAQEVGVPQGIPAQEGIDGKIEGNNRVSAERENRLSTTEQTICQASVGQAPAQRESCFNVDGLQQDLREVENLKVKNEFTASPSLSIVIPTGFGADSNTAFVSGTYQEQTRYSDKDDGAVGIGIGLGDARKAVGVELSYTIASFGNNRDFGSGGFNIKLHRQFAEGLALAVGWNGILNLGDGNDFEHSIYGAVSKIFRTQADITRPFSRVAVTAGIGSGQFRTEDAVDDDDYNINVFGNVAVRIAEPVSFIAEWSGQDLGVGLSIAPFKNFPFVITPALRDITGAGDEARFVLGTGFAIKF
ncbi:MAG TPA: hypothetical protein DEG17_07940 [Cyanobacteria bacterium UBA11149]|nr:hypothetical protein [Cyanobacteria bacterium UBA11367]HBE60183.1 hypothetical protein [Cyanobacteria bacterium UBA11366]HBK66847.1 hypothetical protein [Cyanobacteria bacterium UBA11166]HBR75502.1 hypothetical protein [Cyanobacteria bacterium UBA11159]HBS70600.1 hypothetical protein [Cyanobacteria bacterium UBA11153]HBW88792.1 hypothetical protein [Cyanobacteria bacterium UBA11149]HCA98241.1 hypothetical protein [Cyanobacteria bacterium UBA9226]